MNEKDLEGTLTLYMSFELKDRFTKNQEEESREVMIEQKFTKNNPENCDLLNLANKLYWVDRNYGGFKGNTHVVYISGNKLVSRPNLSVEQARKYLGQEHD